MLTLRRCTGLAVALGLGAACGGSAFSNASMNGEGGAGTVGTSGGDATASDAAPGSSGEGGTSPGGSGGPASSSGVTDGSGPRADSPTDGPTMACPDVRGTYTVTILQGAGSGCSDLNAGAPQCIREGTQGLCGIEFRSNPSGGVSPAVTGSALLQPNGSLGNAQLTLGTQDRSGCTAKWASASSTLTIDCGGMDSSQSCVVALVRNGAAGVVCN
jgi:hypothetical protein